VEAAFDLANISSQKTKYVHVLTCLPPDILETLKSALDPSCNSPYEKLKQALLKKNTMTAAQALRRLTELGTEHQLKPTKLIEELRKCHRIIQTNADLNKCELIKQQFLAAGLTSIRHHLISFQSLSLEEFSAKTDDHFSLEDTQLMTIEPKNQSSNIAIEKIKSEISWIKNCLKKSHIDRSRLCFYHQRFGKLARKCQTQCSWRAENFPGKAPGIQ